LRAQQEEHKLNNVCEVCKIEGRFSAGFHESMNCEHKGLLDYVPVLRRVHRVGREEHAQALTQLGHLFRSVVKEED